MNTKHGIMSNCSKIFEEIKQNICYSIFKDVNLNMDVIWVLLITESLFVWRLVQPHFSMIQYGFKFELV